MENRCAFEKEHLTGHTWHAEAEPDDGEIRVCHVCNIKVPKDALFCSVCGASLVTGSSSPNAGTEPDANSGVYTGAVKDESKGSTFGWDFPGMEYIGDPEYAIYGGVDPEEEIDGLPAKDLAKYIKVNSGYYLPRFRHISKSGGNISPNFAALFFNFFYYFYRKMYGVGLFLLGVYMLSVIPSFFYTKEIYPMLLQQSGFAPVFESLGMSIPPADLVDLTLAEHYRSIGSVTQLIHFAIGLIVSFYSNRLYLNHCVKSVERIRPKEKDPTAVFNYETGLTQSGGTSKSIVVAIAISIAVLYFISSWIIIYLVLSG